MFNQQKILRSLFLFREGKRSPSVDDPRVVDEAVHCPRIAVSQKFCTQFFLVK
jgi:hypothetical protein